MTELNPQGQWRLEPAKEISHRLRKFEGLQAIVAGGSVARGYANAYSDLVGAIDSERVNTCPATTRESRRTCPSCPALTEFAKDDGFGYHPLNLGKGNIFKINYDIAGLPQPARRINVNQKIL